MKRREFRIGPGAASLMLVAVVLAMSILGTLCLMNARTDLQMARRSAAVAENAAALDAASEASLAALDAILASCAAEAADDAGYIARVAESLPEGMILEERTVYWTEYGAGRTLECAAEIAPLGENPGIAWAIHRHWPDIEGDYGL